MKITLHLAADTYRMIDALKDYAALLENEGSLSMASIALSAAKRISEAPHEAGLRPLDSFDVDAAHGAMIGVMVERYSRAQALKDEAQRLETEARALESALEIF